MELIPPKPFLVAWMAASSPSTSKADLRWRKRQLPSTLYWMAGRLGHTLMPLSSAPLSAGRPRSLSSPSTSLMSPSWPGPCSALSSAMAASSRRKAYLALPWRRKQVATSTPLSASSLQMERLVLLDTWPSGKSPATCTSLASSRYTAPPSCRNFSSAPQLARARVAASPWLPAEASILSMASSICSLAANLAMASEPRITLRASVERKPFWRPSYTTASSRETPCSSSSLSTTLPPFWSSRGEWSSLVTAALPR